MIWLVISDIHDRPDLLSRLWTQTSADRLLCLGDLFTPLVIDDLAVFTGPIDVVLGNNDAQYADRIKARAQAWKRVQIHERYGELAAGEGKIAFTHYPALAQKLIMTNQYQAIFYGHSHRLMVELINGVWVANPGTLGAVFAEATYLLYDDVQNTLRVARLITD